MRISFSYESSFNDEGHGSTNFPLTFRIVLIDERLIFVIISGRTGDCIAFCIIGLELLVPSLGLRLSLISMDLFQLEQAYIKLARILLINKICQGGFLFNPNIGTPFGKLPFSATAITWLVYDFCERVLIET